MIENKRFQFENGSPMNGFWIFKKLNPIEKNICYRIVKGGDIIGWSPNSLNAAHIKKDDINNLIKEGLVQRINLIDISKEILNNDENLERFKDLEENYRLPCNIPKEDKKFFYAFISAKETIDNASDPKNLSTQTQVIEPLYSYLELLL